MEEHESWSGWMPDAYDLSSPPYLEATMEIARENDFPRLAKWRVACSTRQARVLYVAAGAQTDRPFYRSQKGAHSASLIRESIGLCAI